MSAPEFDKWQEVLWRMIGGAAVAFCPKHHHRLEVIDEYGRALAQGTSPGVDHQYLICPIDDERFELFGDSFWAMRRRYTDARESEQFKNATYRDLDNAYTPILRVSPKPKDDRYSIQVEVDETPQGKKLVIYAADRENISEKTQIFIDPEADKITFDSKGDLHPNMIFSKVEAFFKDGKKAILEQEE